MLLYCMGGKAEDILQSFQLSEEDAVKFNLVLEKFDRHFVVRRNKIFEQAKFNKREQLPDESSESFITALHKLAEHCEYGTLRDEMIRDRLVVGIKNAALRKTAAEE